MNKPVQEYTQAIIVNLLIACIDEYDDGKLTRDELNEKINKILDKCFNWWLRKPSGEYRTYVLQRLGKRRMKYLEEFRKMAESTTNTQKKNHSQ